MSFVAKFLGDLFGGGSAPQSQVYMPPPAPAPIAPSRSDAEVREEGARQRRKYALGSSATNLLTGGSGASASSAYSAVTTLLGGGSATG